MVRNPRDIQDRAFLFGCDVVRFCDTSTDQRSTTRHLLGQLIKAGTSIGANLEEASAGQSKADFIAKTAIALKEAREAHYWLRVLSARSALGSSVNPLMQESNRLVAILTAIVRNARSNANRG